MATYWGTNTFVHVCITYTNLKAKVHQLHHPFYKNCKVKELILLQADSKKKQKILHFTLFVTEESNEHSLRDAVAQGRVRQSRNSKIHFPKKTLLWY